MASYPREAFQRALTEQLQLIEQGRGCDHIFLAVDSSGRLSSDTSAEGSLSDAHVEAFFDALHSFILEVQIGLDPTSVRVELNAQDEVEIEPRFRLGIESSIHEPFRRFCGLVKEKGHLSDADGLVLQIILSFLNAVPTGRTGRGSSSWAMKIPSYARIAPILVYLRMPLYMDPEWARDTYLDVGKSFKKAVVVANETYGEDLQKTPLIKEGDIMARYVSLTFGWDIQAESTELRLAILDDYFASSDPGNRPSGYTLSERYGVPVSSVYRFIEDARRLKFAPATYSGPLFISPDVPIVESHHLLDSERSQSSGSK